MRLLHVDSISAIAFSMAFQTHTYSKTPENPKLCCQACHTNAFFWTHYSCTSQIGLVTSKIPNHVQDPNLNLKVYSWSSSNLSPRTHTEYKPCRTLRSSSQFNHYNSTMSTCVSSLSYGHRSFRKASADLWNKLPLHIKKQTKKQKTVRLLINSKPVLRHIYSLWHLMIKLCSHGLDFLCTVLTVFIIFMLCFVLCN